MNINYEGPESLRALIQTEYNLIAEDYDRKNPHIILGFRPTNNLFHIREKGFEDFKDFKRFVDAQIDILGYDPENEKFTAEEKIPQILNSLERVRFEEDTGNYSPADYTLAIDAILLDTFMVAKSLDDFVRERMG